MKNVFFNVVFICLIFSLFFSCSSSDEKANKLFVEASQL